MKEVVKPEVLQQAVKDLQQRFPTYFVQLDRDFYKYKLRTVNNTDVVEVEDSYPCEHIDAGVGDKPMFRVKYFQNRITLEIFHVISDGTGAMCFIKNIVARYIELEGGKVEKTDGVFDLNSTPSKNEIEDSYKKVKSAGGEKTSRRDVAAYKYKQPFKENIFVLTHGFFTVDEMKRVSKEKGVTITEYLAALYTFAFYENMLPEDNKKPVKLSVPIDLRRVFGSETLRGFSLYVNTCTYPAENKRTFDDILAEVAAQLRKGFQKESLGQRVVENTAAQSGAAFRLMPLMVKKMVLKAGYLLLGERTMTTAFTNLGIVKTPPGMSSHLDHFDFVAGGTLGNYLNCAITTGNGIINVIFSSRSESTDVQQTFFAFLAEQGISIDVQSNIKQKAIDSAVMLHCKHCNVYYKDNHHCCPLCGKKGKPTQNQPLCVTAPYPEIES
jgi:NRPS condensation-like uncharacterized protein